MLRNVARVRPSFVGLFAVVACAPSATSPRAGAVRVQAAADAGGAPPLADPSTLAVPGPAAAPCTGDAMCANHRCNAAYGKCAFPCVSDADCAPGASCFKAVISTCQTAPPDR